MLELSFITNLDCIKINSALQHLITFESYTMDSNMHINLMVYLILRKLPKPQKFIFELFGPCNKFNRIKDENNKDNTWKNYKQIRHAPWIEKFKP